MSLPTPPRTSLRLASNKPMVPTAPSALNCFSLPSGRRHIGQPLGSQVVASSGLRKRKPGAKSHGPRAAKEWRSEAVTYANAENGSSVRMLLKPEGTGATISSALGGSWRKAKPTTRTTRPVSERAASTTEVTATSVPSTFMVLAFPGTLIASYCHRCGGISTNHLDKPKTTDGG